MNPWQIRQEVGREEVDYVLLSSLFAAYKKPRDKISRLLKSGAIVRVKKGLYVFGQEVARGPYSKEVLANLIYGPSAISLEYALSFHGLIPERVQTVTSITPKKNKMYDTPAGRFIYQYLNLQKYFVGLTQVQIDNPHHILIAKPEKALADYLVFRMKGGHLKTEDELEDFLLNDLRIDEDKLSVFDINLLETIANIYKNPKILLLLNYLEKRG